MENAKQLRAVRRGQYPKFRQRGSRYTAGLPFVLCRGFLFSAIVPNLGIPLLFWQMESNLRNGYSLWIPRNFERGHSKNGIETICNNALPLLNSIGPCDIHIKMKKQLCFSKAGLKRQWVFDASCTANCQLFEPIKHQFELFWRSITREHDSDTTAG